MASDPPPPITWLWLRHAPIATPGRLTGQSDPPLGPVTPATVSALKPHLRSVTTVLSSPARRCRETLATLRAAGADLPEERVEPAFWEQNFGAWEGADPAACPWPRAAERATLAGFAPPAGESFAEVCTRVGAAIDSRTADSQTADSQTGAEAPGSTLLVCAHAGTIRAALALALGAGPAPALAFDVRPLSLTRLTALAGGWRIDAVNLSHEAESPLR